MAETKYEKCNHPGCDQQLPLPKWPIIPGTIKCLSHSPQDDVSASLLAVIRKPPNPIPGLLLSAELALQEVRKKLGGGVIAGSPQDGIRTQLATCFNALEMIKYHLKQLELGHDGHQAG